MQCQQADMSCKNGMNLSVSIGEAQLPEFLIKQNPNQECRNTLNLSPADFFSRPTVSFPGVHPM